jgi:hypothetical protein
VPDRSFWRLGCGWRTKTKQFNRIRYEHHQTIDSREVRFEDRTTDLPARGIDRLRCGFTPPLSALLRILAVVPVLEASSLRSRRLFVVGLCFPDWIWSSLLLGVALNAEVASEADGEDAATACWSCRGMTEKLTP